MKKNIDFYIGKAEAINISNGIDKFGLKLSIIAKNTYSYEEMQEIFSYLSEKGIQIEIEFKDKKIKPINKDYQNNHCGECEYYESEFGCMNETSKIRSKSTRTKMSKGCYWGKWN